MTITDDVRTRIDTVDRQIIDLLAQRRYICQEASEEGEKEDAMDTVGWWLEEGSERNLDEASLERISRSVVSLCQKGGEE